MDSFAGCSEAVSCGESWGEVDGELSGVGAALGGFNVADDLPAVEIVIVGKDIDVGHVENLEAEDARLLLLVDKGGIGELCEPVVVVEDGVVDAVGTFGADVSGWDTEVLEEWSV